MNLDARGYDGIAYVGVTPLSQGAFTRPKISQYDVMLGPTYRFYLQPKYSISGRAEAGWAYGNFTGDTNGEGSLCYNGPGSCLLYSTGSTFAASVAIWANYNITPTVALRLAPEYHLHRLRLNGPGQPRLHHRPGLSLRKAVRGTVVSSQLSVVSTTARPMWL